MITLRFSLWTNGRAGAHHPPPAPTPTNAEREAPRPGRRGWRAARSVRGCHWAARALFLERYISAAPRSPPLYVSAKRGSEVVSVCQTYARRRRRRQKRQTRPPLPNLRSGLKTRLRPAQSPPALKVWRLNNSVVIQSLFCAQNARLDVQLCARRVQGAFKELGSPVFLIRLC